MGAWNMHVGVYLTLCNAEDGAEACFNHGCVVTFTLRSLEAGRVSTLDLDLARAIDAELFAP